MQEKRKRKLRVKQKKLDEKVNQAKQKNHLIIKLGTFRYLYDRVRQLVDTKETNTEIGRKWWKERGDQQIDLFYRNW